MASVFTLVLVLRQSSENRSITYTNTLLIKSFYLVTKELRRAVTARQNLTAGFYFTIAQRQVGRAGAGLRSSLRDSRCHIVGDILGVTLKKKYAVNTEISQGMRRWNLVGS